VLSFKSKSEEENDIHHTLITEKNDATERSDDDTYHIRRNLQREALPPPPPLALLSRFERKRRKTKRSGDNDNDNDNVSRRCAR